MPLFLLNNDGEDEGLHERSYTPRDAGRGSGRFGNGGHAGMERTARKADNFLFILADDMGFADLSCYMAATLAQQGIGPRLRS